LANQAAGGANSDLVGLPDVMVQTGSHLATYFSSEAGRLRIAEPFLREGITLGQPCFLIANGPVLERYITALETDAKDELAEARRRGLFETAPAPGKTVEEAMTFWNDRITMALNGTGHTVVRIVGDMACVKENFGSIEQLLLFERRVDSILTHYPTVAICQYDVREFDGQSLLEAIKAHPGVSDLGFTKFVS
jgi:DcmR-like sensory protein